MKRIIRITTISLFVLLIFSCKKKLINHVDLNILEPSRWEIIPGKYKVFDTLGGYLYDMEIIYKAGDSIGNSFRDSLQFINMDGQYNFTYRQSNTVPNNYPKYYFSLGVFDPLIDTLGNRTFFFGISAALINDTIEMKFQKNNIKYYLHDAVPYYACDCKQIAVKQH